MSEQLPVSSVSIITATLHTELISDVMFRMNYKDYNMESRLQFRIHAALNTMGSFAAKLPPSRTPA